MSFRRGANQPTGVDGGDSGRVRKGQTQNLEGGSHRIGPAEKKSSMHWWDILGRYAREHTAASTGPGAGVTDHIQTFLIGNLSGGVRTCVR